MTSLWFIQGLWGRENISSHVTAVLHWSIDFFQDAGLKPPVSSSCQEMTNMLYVFATKYDTKVKKRVFEPFFMCVCLGGGGGGGVGGVGVGVGGWGGVGGGGGGWLVHVLFQCITDSRMECMYVFVNASKSKSSSVFHANYKDLIATTFCMCHHSEWMITFNGLLGTADIGVHVVHTSHVIITYALESVSSFIYVTQYTDHN